MPRQASKLVTYVFLRKEEAGKLGRRKRLREEDLPQFSSYGVITIANGAERSSEMYRAWKENKEYICVKLY